MNIFILDNDVNTSAMYHCDKHVIKMMVEYTQMLSTTCRFYGQDVGYRSTHVNHPCTKWTRASLSNWRYLKKLVIALHEEYRARYGNKIHKSYEVAMSLPEPNFIDIGLTKFACAMPDEYITDDPVESYRRFYVNDKAKFAKWKITIPDWMNDSKYKLP